MARVRRNRGAPPLRMRCFRSSCAGSSGRAGGEPARAVAPMIGRCSWAAARRRQRSVDSWPRHGRDGAQRWWFAASRGSESRPSSNTRTRARATSGFCTEPESSPRRSSPTRGSISSCVPCSIGRTGSRSRRGRRCGEPWGSRTRRSRIAFGSRWGFSASWPRPRRSSRWLDRASADALRFTARRSLRWARTSVVESVTSLVRPPVRDTVRSDRGRRRRLPAALARAYP